MINAENEIESKVRAFDGTEFIITRRRWLHILDRHTELRRLMEGIKATASAPDEVYVDPRGALHLVRRPKGAATDFLVVIARRMNSKIYLITAYLIGHKRKERRYRKFKRLQLF